MDIKLSKLVKAKLTKKAQLSLMHSPTSALSILKEPYSYIYVPHRLPDHRAVLVLCTMCKRNTDF